METKAVVKELIYLRCKHLSVEMSGCKCVLNRPEFWNDDMCQQDKVTLCPALEVKD